MGNPAGKTPKIQPHTAIARAAALNHHQKRTNEAAPQLPPVFAIKTELAANLQSRFAALFRLDGPSKIKAHIQRKKAIRRFFEIKALSSLSKLLITSIKEGNTYDFIAILSELTITAWGKSRSIEPKLLLNAIRALNSSSKLRDRRGRFARFLAARWIQVRHSRHISLKQMRVVDNELRKLLSRILPKAPTIHGNRRVKDSAQILLDLLNTGSINGYNNKLRSLIRKKRSSATYRLATHKQRLARLKHLRTTLKQRLATLKQQGDVLFALIATFRHGKGIHTLFDKRVKLVVRSQFATTNRPSPDRDFIPAVALLSNSPTTLRIFIPLLQAIIGGQRAYDILRYRLLSESNRSNASRTALQLIKINPKRAYPDIVAAVLSKGNVPRHWLIERIHKGLKWALKTEALLARQAMRNIIDAVKSGDDEHTRTIIEELGHFPLEETKRLLQTLLKSKHKNTRDAALRGYFNSFNIKISKDASALGPGLQYLVPKVTPAPNQIGSNNKIPIPKNVRKTIREDIDVNGNGSISNNEERLALWRYAARLNTKIRRLELSPSYKTDAELRAAIDRMKLDFNTLKPLLQHLPYVDSRNQRVTAGGVTIKVKGNYKVSQETLFLIGESILNVWPHLRKPFLKPANGLPSLEFGVKDLNPTTVGAEYLPSTRDIIINTTYLKKADFVSLSYVLDHEIGHAIGNYVGRSISGLMCTLRPLVSLPIIGRFLKIRIPCKRFRWMDIALVPNLANEWKRTLQKVGLTPRIAAHQSLQRTKGRQLSIKYEKKEGAARKYAIRLYSLKSPHEYFADGYAVSRRRERTRWTEEHARPILNEFRKMSPRLAHFLDLLNSEEWCRQRCIIK